MAKSLEESDSLSVIFAIETCFPGQRWLTGSGTTGAVADGARLQRTCDDSRDFRLIQKQQNWFVQRWLHLSFPPSILQTPWDTFNLLSLTIPLLQKYHSESKGTDQVAETQAQIDELKGIMVRNIGTCLPAAPRVRGPPGGSAGVTESEFDGGGGHSWRNELMNKGFATRVERGWGGPWAWGALFGMNLLSLRWGEARDSVRLSPWFSCSCRDENPPQ